MYRVKFNPVLAVSTCVYSEEFVSLNEAKQCLNTIANYTLFLHEATLMNDHSNAGWIEEFDGEEWYEIDHWDLED